MRLIDADELKKELYQQWFMDILLTQRNSEDMFYALAQKIDEQPTAYDIEKVVQQLEEFRQEMEQFGCSGILTDIIEIVEQTAIEYNNGWIPCSERLPEEPKENPIFDGKALEVYLVTAKYGNNEQDEVYPFRAFWNGVFFTDGLNILDVIAWQPLPEPYQPKG